MTSLCRLRGHLEISPESDSVQTQQKLLGWNCKPRSHVYIRKQKGQISTLKILEPMSDFGGLWKHQTYPAHIECQSLKCWSRTLYQRKRDSEQERERSITYWLRQHFFFFLFVCVLVFGFFCSMEYDKAAGLNMLFVSFIFCSDWAERNCHLVSKESKLNGRGYASLCEWQKWKY